MALHLRRVVLGAVLCSLACALPAQALHEFELWRSPGGALHGLVLNPTDHSVWVALGNTVYHYGADHTPLATVELWEPAAGSSLCADPLDGSCWVSDWAPQNIGTSLNDWAYELVHLAADGTELCRAGGQLPPGFLSPTTGPDGSVWMVGTYAPLLRFSAEGELVAQATTLQARRPCANPADGTCWAIDAGTDELVHVGLDGAELWRGGSFSSGTSSVRVCGADGSVWVFDSGADDLVHLSQAGVEVGRAHLAGGGGCLTVDQTDGSCWARDATGTVHVAADGSFLGHVAGTGNVLDLPSGTFWSGAYGTLRHTASDGTELWRRGGDMLGTAYFDKEEGTCWVLGNVGEVLRLSAHGEVLWRGGGFGGPEEPRLSALNPADGSLWTLFGNQARLLRLARDGSEQWVDLDYVPDPLNICGVWALAVDPRDSSCWAALSDVVDTSTGKDRAVLLHFGADGTVLAQVPRTDVWGLAVDPTDGSVWMTALLGNSLTRLNADGTEAWHLPASGHQYYSPCLDPTDGSCWVSGDQIRHFSKDGALLLQIPEPAGGVVYDPVEQRVWAAQRGFLSAYDARGWLVWRGAGFTGGAVAVDPRDGSVWAESGGHYQIVHLWVPITPFPDIPPEHWAARAILACYKAGIVGGYPDGLFHPEIVVTRDQMAVFISRALAGSDDAVPDGPPTPTFPDVLPEGTEAWAYKYVEYCVAEQIVGGYPEGDYRPLLELDRGQMAVFIARAMAPIEERPTLPSYVAPSAPSFPDVLNEGGTAWMYRETEYIHERGIVNGYPEDGWYHPERPVTRDQMAVFIARAFALDMGPR